MVVILELEQIFFRAVFRCLGQFFFESRNDKTRGKALSDRLSQVRHVLKGVGLPQIEPFENLIRPIPLYAIFQKPFSQLLMRKIQDVGFAGAFGVLA